MKKYLSIAKKVAIVVILCTIVIIPIKFTSFNDHEYTVTITDKERVSDDDTSKYLVFAEGDNGDSLVFENTDNWFRFKFSSSNLQGEIKEQETYKITVIGYRFPLNSSYENIIKIEKIN